MKRIIPLIHMNGNSKAALESQYSAAHDALREAIEKFGKIEFHKRDYYPRGEEAWDQAVKERGEVIDALNLTKEYLEELAEGIYNQ